MNKELLNTFQNFVSSKIIDDFSNQQARQFAVYFDLIEEWNKKFNLMSYKSGNDLIYRHFCDSLYNAKIIKEFSSNLSLTIADLGSGSGMPAIPVKIALPQMQITLIESITKKCKFLEIVHQELNLSMQIINDRAESIGQISSHRQKYDFVLSRAVSKLSPNLEIAAPLLKIGGFFIVHKTKDSANSSTEGLPAVENALKHLGLKLDRVFDYNLPEQSFDYCLLIFKKDKDTPKQFPRKAAAMQKKPL
ncbi:MAG: 16S rRNA (guanine(527)-N(7))-methyltransferase RsmG [Elusimicrobiota bacterium]|jgi:16S rRNA (guanine527-N7)-methyltransferase|nr:16S rRNA (guanine(527)-N(7))-methyltransferase RsmG [Elusimicrobiota bacterium]